MPETKIEVYRKVRYDFKKRINKWKDFFDKCTWFFSKKNQEDEDILNEKY